MSLLKLLKTSEKPKAQNPSIIINNNNKSAFTITEDGALNQLDFNIPIAIKVATSNNSNVIVTLPYATSQSATIYRLINGVYSTFTVRYDSTAINNVAVSPDGNVVLICLTSAAVRAYRWNGSSYAYMDGYLSQSFSINSIGFSPDGLMLMCGGQDTTRTLHMYKVNPAATTFNTMFTNVPLASSIVPASYSRRVAVSNDSKYFMNLSLGISGTNFILLKRNANDTFTAITTPTVPSAVDGDIISTDEGVFITIFSQAAPWEYVFHLDPSTDVITNLGFSAGFGRVSVPARFTKDGRFLLVKDTVPSTSQHSIHVWERNGTEFTKKSVLGVASGDPMETSFMTEEE